MKQIADAPPEDGECKALQADAAAAPQVREKSVDSSRISRTGRCHWMAGGLLKIGRSVRRAFSHPLFCPSIYRICSRIFLLLQSAGNSIQLEEDQGQPRGGGMLGLPA